jgi:integrase
MFDFDAILAASTTTAERALQRNSRATYTSSMNAYEDVMSIAFPLRDCYPVTIESIKVFLELSKSDLHRACHTLINYISALAWYFRTNNLPDLTKTEELRGYRKGLKKEMRDRAVPNRKLPLNGEHLTRIIKCLDMHDHEAVRFYACACLSYFGLLRVSELCNLFLDDLTFSPDSVVINIRYSKTDQTGHGQELEILQTGVKYDACRWLRVLTNLLKEGRTHADKVWPWGASQFRMDLREALTKSGLTDVKRYSCHSFRRGGAQAAHRAGATDCEIKALGRWKSECYQDYVNVSGREAGRKLSTMLALE